MLDKDGTEVTIDLHDLHQGERRAVDARFFDAVSNASPIHRSCDSGSLAASVSREARADRKHFAEVTVDTPPGAGTRLPSLGVEASWKDEAVATIKQEGLVEYRLSVHGIRSSSRVEPPGAVFVGTGLCSSTEISAALPLDALGMVLPAVRLQRALAARSVIVLIADEHARSNGCFLPYDIDAIAAENEDALRRAVSAFGLNSVKIVRASHFHFTPEYLSVLDEVDQRAPDSEHAYFRKEVADIEFLNRVCGGIIKVGWTVSGAMNIERRHDEVAFDRRFRAWMGDHVPFVYCKAGRALDRRRPKASP